MGDTDALVVVVLDQDAVTDGVLEKLGSTAAPPLQSGAFVQFAGGAAPPTQKKVAGHGTPLLLVLPTGQ
jgi:hypothetical protein